MVNKKSVVVVVVVVVVVAAAVLYVHNNSSRTEHNKQLLTVDIEIPLLILTRLSFCPRYDVLPSQISSTLAL